MKTNLNTVNMKNLVIAVLILASAKSFAQTELLAFNSTKKRVKIENRLVSLTNEMEKTVRYEAPKVETEMANISEPVILLENAKEFRSWIKEKLEKEACNIEKEAYGSANVSFLIDKNGVVKEYKTDKNSPELEKLLTCILKSAPGIKPLTMNGYAGKQIIVIPIKYRLQLL